MCPALKEARIRAHHNLVEQLWNKLGQTAARVVIWEMTVESLRLDEASLDCRDEWQRAFDKLTDLDLAGPEAVAAYMLRHPIIRFLL